MQYLKEQKSRRRFLKTLFWGTLSGLAHLFGFSRENTISEMRPGYINLAKNGDLKRRAEKLWNIMESCGLCPRMCGANRLTGERGECRANAQLEISSFHPHFGEERPLVGSGGSGTIFLTNCGLKCVFCINWDVSQGGQGEKASLEEFANMMLALQHKGCPNINFVTPTHYAAHILFALDDAASRGLNIPVVYNTCGWERLEILKLLDGIVDIYLPDFKYSDPANAGKYSSGAESYVDVTKTALLEMHRQVGVAKSGSDGLMKRGLMIRHLVMPNNVSGTEEVIEWIAGNLPKDTYLNLMSQYRPVYKAFDYPELARKITNEEYISAISHARAAGLTNLDIQGYY